MPKITAPPSTPEWWLFYLPGKRSQGRMCLGQTAYMAGGRAQAFFRRKWSELEVEFLGNNPVPLPGWTCDEEDLYQYRVARARHGYRMEQLAKQRLKDNPGRPVDL